MDGSRLQRRTKNDRKSKLELQPDFNTEDNHSPPRQDSPIKDLQRQLESTKQLIKDAKKIKTSIYGKPKKITEQYKTHSQQIDEKRKQETEKVVKPKQAKTPKAQAKNLWK